MKSLSWDMVLVPGLARTVLPDRACTCAFEVGVGGPGGGGGGGGGGRLVRDVAGALGRQNQNGTNALPMPTAQVQGQGDSMATCCYNACNATSTPVTEPFVHHA
eukprot:707868-Pelagomonas_calceolata.AAC.2